MPGILNGRALVRRLRAFGPNQRGNIAIIVAFSMIPLIGLVGIGTDYGVALTDKTKLDNSADSAALAAVATAKAYVAANQSDSNLTADAIAAGLDRAKRAFSVNAGNIPFAQIPTPTITLTKVSQTFSSTVTYQTTTQNHLVRSSGSRPSRYRERRPPLPTSRATSTSISPSTCPARWGFPRPRTARPPSPTTIADANSPATSPARPADMITPTATIFSYAPVP